MQPSSSPPVLQAAVALAMGLVIGLEREHHEADEGKREVRLGVRTFALLALLGWAALFVGTPWIAAAALLTSGIVVGVEYVRGSSRDPGLTTEAAALLTVVVGMVVRISPLVGTALGLATTLLLVSKPWFQAMVPRLRRIEISSTLQLLLLSAVVLPLLPNEPVDPWHILVPRKIGLFVVLVAAISYLGYVLTRLLGPRRGTRLTGLFGGLASSTAVALTMSRRARNRESAQEEQAAILVADAVLVPRVLLLATIVNAPVARALVIPLAAMAAVMLAGAIWRWHRSPERDRNHDIELGNPFALLPALAWGAFFVAILFLSAGAQRWLGDRGLVVAASFAGLADVDAITLSVARSQAQIASLAIVLAVAANTLVKATLAIGIGGWRFGRSVALVSAVAITATVVLAAI